MKRSLGVTGLLCGLALLIAGGIYKRFEYRVLDELKPAIDRAETYRPPGSVLVFDRESNEFDAFWKERRIWVSLDETPEIVWGAVVAAEDRRFFEHGGVDLRGVARAILANLSGGSVSQGGSTLTQQLVKNLIVGKDKTYTRKAREAVVAWELERRLSKEQILELYLNYVYLGSGNHGIEAASRDFFGLSSSQLSPAQAATLAALIPAPSRYDPRISPTIALERRNRVLVSMVEAGHLSKDALSKALDTPISLERPGVDGHRSGASYATQIRRDLVDLLGKEAPYELAMRVHTAMDPAIQSIAERAIGDASAAVMKRQGVWAIVEHLRKQEDRTAFLSVTVDSPDIGDCFHALLSSTTPFELSTKNQKVWTLQRSERSRMVRQRNRLEGSKRPFSSVARVGDKVRVCATSETEVKLDGSDWVQGAAVVIEHHSGEVIALVGGNQPVLEGFVRATQAKRQPGSTFKPLVYAAAIAAGHSQLEVMVDEEITLTAGDGSEWTPGNSGRDDYRGEVPLRTALAASLNSISVQLVNDVGSEKVAAVARRMGIRTPLKEVLSLALGSSEVTVLDQATAFATLANGGIWREPIFIRQLEDREANLLGQAGDLVRSPDGGVLGELPGRTRQALSPGVAFEVSDMMTAVIEGGTGRRAHKKGYWRAGKTGTTNAATDTWFAGFTPRYTVVVWIGTDDNGSLGGGESGSRTALPAWKTIVDALPASPDDSPPVPDEAMLVHWGPRWVGVNRQTVPRTIFPVRRIGDAPIKPFPKERVLADDGTTYVR